MDAATDPSTAQRGGICTAPDHSSPNGDLAWLLHRAAQRIVAHLNTAARTHGLTDFRDWIVLTALADGEKRTQLALGRQVGLDKTTLTAILDRLERDGLAVRTVSPTDRRVRLPEATDEGRRVQAALRGCRDEVESELLSPFTPEETAGFRSVLTTLAFSGENDVHGSCM